MSQTAQYSDLSNRLLLSLRVAQLRSVVLLDGDLLATGLVDALFDDGVGAYTDLVAHVVHAQVVAVGSGELLWLQCTATSGLRISAARATLRKVGASEHTSLICIGVLVVTRFVCILLDPSIEKGIALLVLQLLILEGTSVLLELPRKGILCPSRMILMLTNMH